MQNKITFVVKINGRKLGCETYQTWDESNAAAHAMNCDAVKRGTSDVFTAHKIGGGCIPWSEFKTKTYGRGDYASDPMSESFKSGNSMDLSIR